MRDVVINLRAPPEQLALIDQAAAVLGKNRSQFILEAACDKAQSVLLDQLFFKLDARSFRQFNRLLDAPLAPNPGFERLMEMQPPWEAEASQ